MKLNKQFRNLLYLLFLIISFTSCSNNEVKEKSSVANAENKKQPLFKPPSNYTDTLNIDFPAAVFYHPDSLQLEKIMEITDKGIFESTMHEFFYQMRNARIILKKNWPAIKIIEAKNVRYLLFIRADKSSDCIDLDTKYDAYGLFVFDRKKPPRLLDMSNIDTGLWFYFSE